MPERDRQCGEPGRSCPDYQFYNSLHIIHEKRGWLTHAVNRWPPWMWLALLCLFVLGQIGAREPPGSPTKLVVVGVVLAVLAIIIFRRVVTHAKNPKTNDVPPVEPQDER